MGWFRKNSRASPPREDKYSYLSKEELLKIIEKQEKELGLKKYEDRKREPEPPSTYYDPRPQRPYSYNEPPRQSYSYNEPYSYKNYNEPYSYNNSILPIPQRSYMPKTSFYIETALMISKKKSIVHKYLSISSLLTHNKEGTIGFLKANGGLFAFSISQDSSREFYVPHVGTDNFKAWEDYRDAIEKYLEGICANVKAKDPLYGMERSFKEELRQARNELSNEIHNKHYTRFPRWPDVYCEQSSYVDLDTSNIYNTGVYTILWTCVGWINVTDKRPDTYRYIAEFKGKPDIKLLVIDHDKLRKLENTVAYEGIEKAKKLIGDSKYLKLTWD